MRTSPSFFAALVLALPLFSAPAPAQDSEAMREQLKSIVRERLRELSDRLADDLCRAIDRIFEEAGPPAEARRAEREARRAEERERERGARRRAPGNDAEMAAELERMRAELRSLEEKLEGYRERFSADHPAIRSLERRLAELRRSIDGMAREEGEARRSPATRPAPAPPSPAPGGGAFLGVQVESVSVDYRGLMELDNDEGVRVTAVVPGSAAEKAELKVGDVILSLDGRKVGTFDALREAIQARRAGDKVKLAIISGGERGHRTVTLGRPEENDGDGEDEEDPAEMARSAGARSDDRSDLAAGDLRSLSLAELSRVVDALRSTPGMPETSLGDDIRRAVERAVHGSGDDDDVLGAVVMPVPDSLRADLGGAGDGARLVLSVPAGCRAADLGLRRHDVVLHAAGGAGQGAGESLEVWRAGRRLTLR